MDERLVEAVLARLGPQRWGFYLNQHHLITDAASTALLIRRLADEYTALVEPTDEDLPRMRPYYATVQSLDTLATDPMLQEAAEDWRNRRSQADRSTPFYGRTGRPRSTASRRISLQLDEATSRRLRQVATDSGFEARR